MVVVPQSKNKIEDDDDEDLEKLRMEALQSIRVKDKDTTRKRRPILSQVTQVPRIPYKLPWPIRRNYYNINRVPLRQNGVSFPFVYFDYLQVNVIGFCM